MTLLGQPGTSTSLRKAVHSATGMEKGDDGHLAAPIDLELEGAPR